MRAPLLSRRRAPAWPSRARFQSATTLASCDTLPGVIITVLIFRSRNPCGAQYRATNFSLYDRQRYIAVLSAATPVLANGAQPCAPSSWPKQHVTFTGTEYCRCRTWMRQPGAPAAASAQGQAILRGTLTKSLLIMSQGPHADDSTRTLRLSHTWPAVFHDCC